jgi:hypothetical protein
VHLPYQYLNLAKQFPEGIYDICDFEIARGDFMKHRCEQEKVIVAYKKNLRQAIHREQFLKVNGSIDTAEPAAENDDSLFAWLTRDLRDH